MVHFDFIGGCVLKNQVVINQVEDPISPGVFKQQKQTSIRGEILGLEFDSIDHIHIFWRTIFSDSAFNMRSFHCFLFTQCMKIRA
jgi:hypothetical protein